MSQASRVQNPHPFVFERPKAIQAAAEIVLATLLLFAVSVPAAIYVFEHLNPLLEAAEERNRQTASSSFNYSRTYHIDWEETFGTQPKWVGVSSAMSFSFVTVITYVLEAALAWFVGNQMGGMGEFYQFYFAYTRRCTLFFFVTMLAAALWLALLVSSSVEVLLALLCLTFLFALLILVISIGIRAQVLSSRHQLTLGKSLGTATIAVFAGGFLGNTVSQFVSSALLEVIKVLT